MSSTGFDLILPTWQESLLDPLLLGLMWAAPVVGSVAIAARHGGPIWLAALLGWIFSWIGLALVAVYYLAPRADRAQAPSDEAEAKLRTLNRLLAEGLIDRVEYERKRNEVLERL